MTDIQGPEPTDEQVEELVAQEEAAVARQDDVDPLHTEDYHNGDEIDERLSDPDAAEDEIVVKVGADGYFRIDDAPDDDLPVTALDDIEQPYDGALEASTEDILGDDAAMKAEVDPLDGPIALHDKAATNLALARVVPWGYQGEVYYLYDFDDEGNLRILDGPFRADLPFGLEIQAGQTLGPLPVTTPRED